jgi:hypothetical protein
MNYKTALFGYIEPLTTFAGGSFAFLQPSAFWIASSPILPALESADYPMRVYGVTLMAFALLLHLIFGRYRDRVPKDMQRDVLLALAFGDVIHVSTWHPYIRTSNLNLTSFGGNVVFTIVLLISRFWCIVNS